METSQGSLTPDSLFIIVLCALAIINTDGTRTRLAFRSIHSTSHWCIRKPASCELGKLHQPNFRRMSPYSASHFINPATSCVHTCCTHQEDYNTDDLHHIQHLLNLLKGVNEEESATRSDKEGRLACISPMATARVVVLWWQWRRVHVFYKCSYAQA